MSKSKETYCKKEAEKNRAKKRKEKEQKKEERKAANAKAGKSLEDMMAYVDENGNITTKVPDPNKKKVFKEEDIVIGVRKQEPRNPADLIRKGKVTFFNSSKGYGFIKDQESQESVFVHINSVAGQIKEGDKVTFQVENGPKGPNAVDVKIVG
jgi:cold shock CspA family protein